MEEAAVILIKELCAIFAKNKNNISGLELTPVNRPSIISRDIVELRDNYRGQLIYRGVVTEHFLVRQS